MLGRLSEMKFLYGHTWELLLMKWITFYDVGLMIGLRRLHILPSLEGYDGNFTGIS